MGSTSRRRRPRGDRAQPREHDGVNPLFALERGEITEAEFLAAARARPGRRDRPRRSSWTASASASSTSCTRTTSCSTTSARCARERGLRLALLTNNVREWEPLWRSMLPIDERLRARRRLGVRRHAQARAGDLRDHARAPRAAGGGVRVPRRHRAQLRRRARGGHARRRVSATTRRQSPSSPHCWASAAMAGEATRPGVSSRSRAGPSSRARCTRRPARQRARATATAAPSRAPGPRRSRR